MPLSFASPVQFVLRRGRVVKAKAPVAVEIVDLDAVGHRSRAQLAVFEELHLDARHARRAVLSQRRDELYGWASSRTRTVAAISGAAAAKSDQLGMRCTFARPSGGCRQDVENDQHGRSPAPAHRPAHHRRARHGRDGAGRAGPLLARPSRPSGGRRDRRDPQPACGGGCCSSAQPDSSRTAPRPPRLPGCPPLRRLDGWAHADGGFTGLCRRASALPDSRSQLE